jgi:uncharacterized phage protein (TIGR02218 family)
MTSLTFNNAENIDFFVISTITKINGEKIGLTSLESNLNWQNITYKTGLDFKSFTNTTLNGSDKSGYPLTILNNNDITDLFGSTIEIGFGNQNNTNNIYSFFIGNIISVVYEPKNITINIAPIAYSLKRGIGDFFSDVCRAEFGDNKCKIDKKNFSFNGIITSINGRNLTGNHIQKKSGYFSNGVISFGNNSFRILDDSNNNILIATTPNIPINIGDNYIITAGCNKSVETCKKIFNNIINFRGEPFINN